MQKTQRTTPRHWRTGFAVLVDWVVPIALYYVLRSAGMGVYLALLIGAVVSALSAILKVIRDRRLDGFNLFVLAMMVLSIGVSLINGSIRLLLAKEALGTGAAGIWFLASARIGRPLAFTFSRPLLEGRLGFAPDSWDRLWEEVPRFRHIWRVSSAMWGVGTLADAVIRVVLAYTLPVDLVPALGSALYGATSLVLLIATNIYYTRCGLWPMLRGEYAPAGRADDQAIVPSHTHSGTEPYTKVEIK